MDLQLGLAVPALLASYLIGAIPTSLLVGRAFRGVDLREHGSRNLGATNVYRVLGWKYAVPVALIDMAKGVIPVVVVAPLASPSGVAPSGVAPSAMFALACGMTAVLGHVFSVFVKFKGGKGVATAAGALLGLTPIALSAILVVWGLVLFISGYVSLASISAAALLPAAVLLLEPSRRELVWLDIALAAAIIWFHRANIKRLLAGTENRFGRRATAPRP